MFPNNLIHQKMEPYVDINSNPSMCGEASSSKAEKKMYIGKSDEPGRFDILCGRNKHCYNREGNHHFRYLIGCHLENYSVATSSIERMTVVKVIAKQLQMTGSRFLKFDHEAKRWYLLSEREVGEKISHALRDKYPPRLRHYPSAQQSRRKLLPFSSSISCRSPDHCVSPDSAHKRVSSQGAESHLQYQQTSALSLQDAIMNNDFIHHDDIAIPKEEPVDDTRSSAPLHSSSFLEDLWAVFKSPDQDEENDDEFLDAINTLDFSDLEPDRCVELMHLWDHASKM